MPDWASSSCPTQRFARHRTRTRCCFRFSGRASTQRPTSVPGPGLGRDRGPEFGAAVTDPLTERRRTPLARPQVLAQMLDQRAHDLAPAGHGSATVRSRSTSTGAKAVVAAREPCRRHLPDFGRPHANSPDVAAPAASSQHVVRGHSEPSSVARRRRRPHLIRRSEPAARVFDAAPGSVHARPSPDTKVELFAALFRARTDV